METQAQSVNAAIESSDYARLSSIFTSQFQSLGQGEQRTLAAHFIKTSVASPTFFPSAFRSAQIMDVVHTALNNVPPSVENAADNALRHKIFDFKVNEEEDYSAAARVLSGLKMEENEESAYYMPIIDRCDVFVKVAECYLEEDLTVEAEGAVSKAGMIIEASGIMSNLSCVEEEKDERTVNIILRYKSTHARVLDANRKFLQAAVKYHDLSKAHLLSNSVDADDLLALLGRAVTCAILSPNSPQRQRVLGLVYKDERLTQLDAIPEFQSHSAVLTKMYLNRIVHKRELEQFESTLADHQKAIMSDGLSIVERGVLEHNMVAVSHLYTSIYLTQLGELLGVVDAEKAEKVAAKMINYGSLSGSIDEVDGILRFRPAKGNEISTLNRWNETITNFCMQLNKVADAVRAT